MHSLKAILLAVLLLGCGDEAAKKAELEKQYEAEKQKVIETRAADAAKLAAELAAKKVDKLTADLDEVSKKTSATLEAITAAQNEADREKAQAQLEALRREKQDLEGRLVKVKADAAKAERMQGARISKECMENPLAKGCS